MTESLIGSYTDATVVPAEGARVGFVICRECGATILIDPRDTEEDREQQHTEWHVAFASSEERP